MDAALINMTITELLFAAWQSERRGAPVYPDFRDWMKDKYYVEWGKCEGSYSMGEEGMRRLTAAGHAAVERL